MRSSAPVLQFAGESRGLFCKAHIEEGMVDVRHKHCSHPGCGKQATCNHPNQPTGAYCGQHKLEGMVNVVLKRCQHEGCETFPSFGHPGQPGVQYCRSHKLPGMVRRTAGNMVAMPGTFYLTSKHICWKSNISCVEVLGEPAKVY